MSSRKCLSENMDTPKFSYVAKNVKHFVANGKKTVKKITCCSHFRNISSDVAVSINKSNSIKLDTLNNMFIRTIK